MLSLDDGKKLVELARQSIFFSFEDKTPSLENYKQYSTLQGAFVTLHKNGELRGCIGTPTPVYPLCEAIIKGATAAAFSDPRFTPLQEEEFKDIQIEVSVLTVPKLIDVKNKKDLLKKIIVGRDGLIVKNMYTSGLLLPQVAPELKWSSKELLENTCQKANLSSDAWKDEDTEVYTFQAQIFKEEKGKIIEKKR